MTTGPAVTLSKVTFLAVATVMSLPARVISMLSPFRNCTVSPGLTLLAVSPLACTFQPELLIALATFSAVAKLSPFVSALTVPLVLLVRLLCLTSKVMSEPLARAVVPLPFTKLMSLLVLLSVSTLLPLTEVVSSCTALSAVFLTSLSWLTLTASVSAVPAATLVMVLPPLFKPVLVKVTGCPAVPLLMVTPVLFTLVLPVVRLPSVPRLMSLASCTLRVSLPSATTPMLPLVNVPVAPPLTFTWVPRSRCTTVPLSPM